MYPLELTEQERLEIKLWEKIELEFKDGDRVGIYFARVEDLVGEDIVIDRPAQKSGDETFKTDGKFTVTLFRDDCAYRFDSEFTDHIKLGHRKLYVFRKPEYIYRVQRRRHVRIDVCIPVTFELLEDLIEKKQNAKRAVKYEGNSVNFSASGLLLNTDCELKTGDLFALKIDKKKIKFDFPILAVVRRVSDLPDNRVNAGIEFIAQEQAERFLGPELLAQVPEYLLQFNEQRRQNLIQFVFYYQVNMRKKGLF